MKTPSAEKSQKILDTLRLNIASLKQLLGTVKDDQTKQNILRAIILFSCSAIDAIVKQLIIETLEPVIERDEGAQEQLRVFAQRKLKNGSDVNYAMLAELLTAKNSRKQLIEMLKKDLSFDSLQSSEQLYKVASFFNISTDKLVGKDARENLKKAFNTRNRIIHQMDVDLDQKEIKYFEHSIDEVDIFFSTIETVAQNYISAVNEVLKQGVTKDYAPLISMDNGMIVIGES